MKRVFIFIILFVLVIILGFVFRCESSQLCSGIVRNFNGKNRIQTQTQTQSQIPIQSQSQQNNQNQSNKNNDQWPTVSVNSFDECLLANYPVIDSFPRECKTSDGKIYKENIGNALQKLDLIKISQPKPNSLITSPTTVIGEARGNWFFEAQFTVILVDANGRELGRGLAQAYSDWMTTNFVPFDVTFVFNIPSTATGMLILKKDNPSGLPQNDDQLEIPIRFIPLGSNLLK